MQHIWILRYLEIICHILQKSNKKSTFKGLAFMQLCVFRVHTPIVSLDLYLHNADTRLPQYP